MLDGHPFNIPLFELYCAPIYAPIAHHFFMNVRKHLSSFRSLQAQKMRYSFIFNDLYVSAKTRRELEQKKEYIRHHYVDGHPIREDLPFYQYAEEWYTLKKEPFISDASRSAYHTMFNKHLLPAFGLRHLRAISAGEIQAFINSFADSSKSQITLAVGTLKALFASAYAEPIA